MPRRNQKQKQAKPSKPDNSAQYLCASVAKGTQCPRLRDSLHCKFGHDLKAYLNETHADLRLAPISALVHYNAAAASQDDGASSDNHLQDVSCPSFDYFGICLSGWKCRFLRNHIKPVDVHQPEASDQDCGWVQLFDLDKMRSRANECRSVTEGPEFANSMSVDELKAFFFDRKGELNVVRGDDQRKYRGRKDEVFPRSKAYFELLGEPWKNDTDWTSNPQGRQSKANKNRGGNKWKAPQQSASKEASDSRPDGPDAPHPAKSDSVPMQLDDTAVTQEQQQPAATDAHEAVRDLYAGNAPQLQDTEQLANCQAEDLHQDPVNENTRNASTRDREPVKPRERRSLDFRDKLYLAPLTTIGNLPFRKLCVGYGADITCGEMGLATEFLGGNPSEWALTRRDPSEKHFGIQVAGARAQQVVPAAEAITDACPDVDFLDINCGCPIDLVVKKGAGSALLEHPTKLGKSCIGLSHVLDIPFTIKLRTGFTDQKLVAGNLFKRAAADWGCSAATLHGRTRVQRYSRDANYEHISQAVQELRAYEEEANMPRLPIVGNGDAYDPVAYWKGVEESGVDTIMIARGALMKPWIFTELKERRHWDISASERLEGIRKFCQDGMMHWGSDDQGIATTRRFLLESMSFQYRYVPVGVLDTLPQRLSNQQREWTPRSDLEGLLSSSRASDWRKVASWFLGPEPEGFDFTPKHKSNSESQG